jgi:hypothetical protein
MIVVLSCPSINRFLTSQSFISCYLLLRREEPIDRRTGQESLRKVSTSSFIFNIGCVLFCPEPILKDECNGRLKPKVPNDPERDSVIEGNPVSAQSHRRLSFKSCNFLIIGLTLKITPLHSSRNFYIIFSLSKDTYLYIRPK